MPAITRFDACMFLCSHPGSIPRLHRLIQIHVTDNRFLCSPLHSDRIPREQVAAGISLGEASEPSTQGSTYTLRKWNHASLASICLGLRHNQVTARNHPVSPVQF